jgi:ribosomal-protein-alanine N-acetyltransferase
MSVDIRKMTLDDLEQVVALDQMSFSLPWPARSFQFELTDNPASRSWVAELDG